VKEKKKKEEETEKEKGKGSEKMIQTRALCFTVHKDTTCLLDNENLR
jgi:hypothetical protein